jgi:phage host-nuclease inhibitor protein Gam
VEGLDSKVDGLDSRVYEVGTNQLEMQLKFDELRTKNQLICAKGNELMDCIDSFQSQVTKLSHKVEDDIQVDLAVQSLENNLMKSEIMSLKTELKQFKKSTEDDLREASKSISFVQTSSKLMYGEILQ